MAIRKIPASHAVANALTYIGNPGHLFYDPADGKLRLSDGVTPGGQLIYIEGDSMYWDEDIVPTLDNTYNLGSELLRWRSVHIGPGTLYIQDHNDAGLNVALTVVDGVLKIDGANQLQVGQLKFVDNTIESSTGDVDIQIGLTESTANLVLNRNTTLSGNLSVDGFVVGDLGVYGNIQVRDGNDNITATIGTDGNISYSGTMQVDTLGNNDGTANLVTYSGGTLKAGPSLHDYAGNIGANNITITGLFKAPQTTKASNATGVPGQICWDANYMYVCTATNTWKRLALTGGY